MKDLLLSLQTKLFIAMILNVTFGYVIVPFQRPFPCICDSKRYVVVIHEQNPRITGFNARRSQAPSSYPARPFSTCTAPVLPSLSC